MIKNNLNQTGWSDSKFHLRNVADVARELLNILLIGVFQSNVAAQTRSALETLAAVSASEQLDQSETRESTLGL